MWMYLEGAPMTICARVSHRAFPRWIYPGEPHPYFESHRKILRFPTFADACEEIGARTAGFVRTYALGDILMLIPVARALHRSIGIDVRLLVPDAYARLLRQCNSPGVEFMRWNAGRMHNYPCDIHMDLNPCLQADHRGGEESNHHRVHLYLRAMGMEPG